MSHATAPSAKKQERQSTISETFKAAKRAPTKKKAAPAPPSPADKASPAKRKKKVPAPALHPQLPTPTYDPYDQEAESARKFYEQVESCAHHVRSLGLPVNYEDLHRVLCDPSQSFDLYVAHLQQPFPSPVSIDSSPVGLPHPRAVFAGQYAAAQAAARAQQQQQAAAAARLTPAPTPAQRSIPLASPAPVRPVLFQRLEPARPAKLIFSVDGSGRAELCPRSSPTPPPLDMAPRTLRAEPKAHVIAAEVEGMGRVVTEWSVLVDHLGPARATVAESRARGTLQPASMNEAAMYYGEIGPVDGLAFAEKGRRVRTPFADEDAQVVAERNERIHRWLVAEDGEEGAMVVEEAVVEPPVPEEPEVLEETVLVSGKSVRSLLRVKRRREDFEGDDIGRPFEVVTADAMRTPLPKKVTTRSHTRATTSQTLAEDGDIACHCAMGEVEGEDMVQCECCRSWFHLSCLGLDAGDLPDAWECQRCVAPTMAHLPPPHLMATPARAGDGYQPTLVHSAFTPRVGHFSRAIASEVALAPSPIPASSHRVRIASGYSPRSPSVSRNSSYTYGQRRRLQSGAFDDPMPFHDVAEVDVETHVPPSAWYHGSTPVTYVAPPVPMAPSSSSNRTIYPSTPSRYVYKSADGLAQAYDPTPPSTIDGGSHSRSSSSAGRRFSLPSTPVGSHDLFAPFDSASSTRYADLPSFSPVCDSATAAFYRQRYASVSKDLVNMGSPSAGGGHHHRQPSYGYALPAQHGQAWARGAPGSSAALVKAMMGGASAAPAMEMARTSSGLGIGFDASTDVGDLLTMDY